jgi:hypothetical protein
VIPPAPYPSSENKQKYLPVSPTSTLSILPDAKISRREEKNMYPLTLLKLGAPSVLGAPSASLQEDSYVIIIFV